MAFQDVIAADPSAIPGALQHKLERRTPLGLIEFEQAPARWLKKDGERRLADWRAYYWTPNSTHCGMCDGHGRVPGKRDGTTKQCVDCKGSGDTSRRTRFPSVTTCLDSILPKPGLPPWYEARGIEGAIEAVRLELIDPHDEASAAMAVDVVREHRLGADAEKNKAAGRGLNVHACLQHYMETGELPRPQDHLPEHHGYVAALVDWLQTSEVEPVAVEELVCDPVAGYAGRYDLCAKVRDGRVGLFDAKTSEKCQIYEAAHLQVELYRRAALACGDGDLDFTRVVVFGPGGAGDWREMDGDADGLLVDLALAYAAALRPVSSACARANAAEKRAREAVKV